jgi:O-antigen ligase
LPGTSTTIRATTVTSTRTTTPKPQSSSDARPRAIVLLAAWIVFAFAGLEPWTLIPLTIGVVVLALLQRPRIATPPNTVLDLALCACLVVVALQLVPLAPSLRERVAPGSVTFDRTLRFAGVAASATASEPASLEAGATRYALILGGTVVLLFWTARALFAQGGLRVVVRGVAWIGIVLAPLAILTHAISPKLIYGIWPAYARSASPYGPFVNRNDLACWLVMAIPLTIGYFVTRVASRQSRSLASALDATALWLAASVILMMAALLGSVSRSGLTGVAVSTVCLAALSSRSLTPRRAASISIAFVALVIVAATFADLDLLLQKAAALSDGVNRRQIVWHFTWTMVKDFWPSGTGMGGFQHAILLYPQPFPLFYINHAHNQYLQFAAEGGLFLLAPASVALAAAVVLMRRRLREDRSPAFWIRAGAVSGIAGILVQSLWETTGRMPANAVLFAVLAAVALHESDATRRR